MNASTTSMDIDSPWMFANSVKYSTPAHSTPALALARAGGPEGTTYLYQLDDAPAAAPGYYSTSATGAKRRCGALWSSPTPHPRRVSSNGILRIRGIAHAGDRYTPTHVLHGFIADEPTLGRLVFVHLPPTHASAPARPEVLAPHFFNVLHSDGPTYSAAPAPPTGPVALDIRESLTALLDLADEIEGTQLVLILDKDEREPAPLAELMHALMYVGGTPVRPGAPVGEWEWDARRWALVSIEL